MVPAIHANSTNYISVASTDVTTTKAGSSKSSSPFESTTTKVSSTFRVSTTPSEMGGSSAIEEIFTLRLGLFEYYISFLTYSSLH